jgi:hypothetical protein
MPSHADLPIGYSSFSVLGDIMSYPFHDIYSHEQKNGELLSKILLYSLEHITKKREKCVILITFSELDFMGSKAK